ncbi:NAD(P)/FAD-dependent oxidoreductase [Roseomonas sp. CCTCC AB2023176]|uniref:NAD(P)/FAD-dependent oxidoreductase n=1 Tax=Roseomonas sp. CCTCC AB2023176 TaxID=3342640 RepID=UPI0035DA81ED
MTDAEVIVLGAGPAGCAAATGLARAGRDVLLLERDAVPREVVCGEFLGPDAVAALRVLGLDAAAMEAVSITSLRIGAGMREAAAPLPFPAWGLPRRVLDGALRDAAAHAGAGLYVGRAVVAAERNGGLWHLRLRDGAALTCRALVLATGKHALRGHPRLPARDGATGLKLHLRGLDLAGTVHLLPFPGGYAGLQPTIGGANLCAAIRDAPGEAARDTRALLARVAAGSALAARLLSGAEPATDRPLAVAGVPYGFLHRAAAGPPGLYRVGDQAAVIPSLTGDGIAMALHSGLAAARAIVAGRPAAEHHAAWGAAARAPMAWAGLTSFVLHRAPATLAVVATVPGLPALFARRTRIAA